VVGIEKEARA
jgi:hypothetical protein